MERFQNARQAKEYLISIIVNEAQREGVPLSEVERKMLYFSETGWTIPDMTEVNQKFETEYSQLKYEKKIAMLIRGATIRNRKENPEEYDSWLDAVRALRKEDHYLLVMVDQARHSVDPREDRFKLWGTGMAVAGVIVVGSLLAARYDFDLDKFLRYFPSRSTLSLVMWAIAACLTIVYVLLLFLIGRQRVNRLFVEVIERVFTTSGREK